MTGVPQAQLRLWPGRGLRGRPLRGAGAVEFKLHCAVADLIRLTIRPGWRWTHLPMGEYRAPATAGRLQRMGVTAGWPDLMFVHSTGKMVWLELKRRGVRTTSIQDEVAEHLTTAGHGYYVADSYGGAVAFLVKHGVIKREVNHGTAEEGQRIAG